MMIVKHSGMSGTIIWSKGQQQMIRDQMFVCFTAYKYCVLITVLNRIYCPLGRPQKESTTATMMAFILTFWISIMGLQDKKTLEFLEMVRPCQRWLIQFGCWPNWSEPVEQHSSWGGWCIMIHNSIGNTICSRYILHSPCRSKMVQNCPSELWYVSRGVGCGWLPHLWSSTMGRQGVKSWLLHYQLLCGSHELPYGVRL